MKVSRTLLTALLLSACASNTSAGPDATEKLLAEVPDTWVKVIERNTGQLAVSEYIPPDTGQDWTEKLIIEALSGSDLPDPLVFVQGLAQEQGEVCNDFTESGVFAGFENGYPTAVHMMQCPENKRTKNAMLTMVKVIRGNNAFYTVTRIWRLPPVTEDEDGVKSVPVGSTEIGAWSQALRQIQVCDPALSAHACPPQDER